MENKSGSGPRLSQATTWTAAQHQQKQGEEKENFYLCDKAFIDGLKNYSQTIMETTRNIQTESY